MFETFRYITAHFQQFLLITVKSHFISIFNCFKLHCIYFYSNIHKRLNPFSLSYLILPKQKQQKKVPLALSDTSTGSGGIWNWIGRTAGACDALCHCGDRLQSCSLARKTVSWSDDAINIIITTYYLLRR